MGNQLVGIAPSQIFPVEHYLIGSFESDLQYESSMGSTRFFKVARAKSDEGLVVVKVFIKHDPSLPLEKHAEKLDYIKKNLANAVNCLPFQRFVLTEKACLIMREYIKHSLYDRVSTRPFLTVIEKKWITFQVLCALHQCHKQKICHGDIKLENILITSWNWILLSDFASFKPTFLPEDNPSDYMFFFDTSRRRTCYIAPERFVKTAPPETVQPKDGLLVGDGPCYAGQLTPEMDIFSAGCALLELWTEGTAPFEFSQLLSYRSGDQELVTKHLQGIENVNLRSLLASMLSRNPNERRSAELYLAEERGRLFPEYFYSFLQSYLQMFSSIPIVPPDDKVVRLHADISQIIDILTESGAVDGQDEKNDLNEKPLVSDNDGLIIITSVVTSCIRGLHHCNSKLYCLDVLQKLAKFTTSETILDRILPYIIHMGYDTSPLVRVAALCTLTDCLCLVKQLPRSDMNVFPEYVLPAIAAMASDSSVIVRVAYAKNIARIAETAVHFLEQYQLNCPTEMPPARFDDELCDLHEMLQQTVSCLLTDSQTIVKQTLIESGITKLCVFFGKQRANDIILSHMITFLNDKEDKNLRGSFFDCIVGVAAYVGWQCSNILIPLLQQGLTDTEEFVIAKSIRATTALTELGLIQKSGLTEFMFECACYLNHPNLWIRHEVCGLISRAAQTLSALDVQCKIMPAISNHLKTPLIQVEKTEILLDCLQPPVPRNIFDTVVKFSDINQLLKTLGDRQDVRAKVADGVLPQYGEMGTALRNLFRKLSSEGLTELAETQLLSMRTLLVKLNKYKTAETRNSPDGKIVIDQASKVCQQVPLLDPFTKNDIYGIRKPKKSDLDSNSEWQHMFGATDSSPNSPSSPSDGGQLSSATPNSPPTGVHHLQPTPSSSLVEYSMPERCFLQERMSECRQEFENLTAKLKGKYSILAGNRNRDYIAYNSLVAPSWRYAGSLVAHLHEHKGAVTRMAALKANGSLFASTSIDGTVRLWDCSKLDGHHSINRSRQAYTANTPLHAITACDSGQSLAVAGKDGSLLLLRIDPNSTKMALQQARHFESNSKVDKSRAENDDGPVVDMLPLNHSGQSVIVYATLYGALVGWDIRMPGCAWRLDSDLRNGVITTFCVDPTSSWMTVGTSSGKHICWDLRFKLPIAEIKHPHAARIRRVACHPTEPSCLISASHGNSEVSVWNIETGERQAALWTSSAPPLSNANGPSHSVCALLPGVVDRSGFLITAGTDQAIRYWDLVTPKNCSLVVPAPKDYSIPMNVIYEPRLIDGTRVIHEMRDTGSHQHVNSASSSGRSTDEPPRSGPELPSPGHHDVITDLTLCQTQKQTFIVSSSRDGVIKIWK